MNNNVQNVFIIIDRLELYKDFSINLLYCIHDYYLDKSSLSNTNDIKNHFKWCFNRVNNEFKKENICFIENKILINYFFSYYKTNFYENNSFKNKDEIDFKLYLKFWNDIFDPTQDGEYLKILLELYLMFDITISNKNKIKEVVV